VLKGKTLQPGGRMARINIEDSIFRDNRFIKLAVKTGSMEMALGCLVRAWMTAQKFYLTPEKTIPRKEWAAQELSDVLIEVGLAEVVGEAIRMKGADAQFAWLEQRVNAGKLGGKKRSLSGSKRSLSETKRSLSEIKRGEPSYSYSYSSSPSFSDSSSHSKEKETSANADGVPPEASAVNSISAFIMAYVLAYQKRYGPKTRPALNGKTQGQIKRFLAETPNQRAQELIKVYCEMNDSWFLTKAHDFQTFVENQNKISLAADTGKTVTRKEALNAETMDFFQAQAARLTGGENG